MLTKRSLILLSVLNNFIPGNSEASLREQRKEQTELVKQQKAKKARVEVSKAKKELDDYLETSGEKELAEMQLTNPRTGVITTVKKLLNGALIDPLNDFKFSKNVKLKKYEVVLIYSNRKNGYTYGIYLEQDPKTHLYKVVTQADPKWLGKVVTADQIGKYVGK